MQTFPLRCIQGGRRRDGAGIWPLLRYANLRIARRLPHRSESYRRGVARLFQLFDHRCNLVGRTYRVFGYKGKQVRDNIHSHDVVAFMQRFIETPRQEMHFRQWIGF